MMQTESRGRLEPSKPQSLNFAVCSRAPRVPPLPCVVPQAWPPRRLPCGRSDDVAVARPGLCRGWWAASEGRGEALARRPALAPGW